jgi:hypothetical protein
MHTREDMLNLLMRLNLHYPQSGRPASELAALAADWVEDMAPFPRPVMERALLYARREARWFPSTAQMLEYCRRAMGEYTRHQERLALMQPEGDMEANIERGRRWTALIVARLRAQAEDGKAGGVPKEAQKKE